MKLAVQLGLRDKVEKGFSLMLDDMFSKFKNKQGLFKGYQKTYTPIDGYADEPSKRGYEAVASTVGEQLSWFKTHVQDYFNIVFSIEKTNATGVTSDLVVDGKNWGTYTTLELLRLKSILDGKIKSLIHELPIRKESVIWKESTNGEHEGREIYESPIDEGFSKTTIKESYILVDPHPDKSRQPIVGEKSTQVNIGSYTAQEYSGEYTTRQRAIILAKYDNLYKAVIAALENANTIESQESDLGNKVLEFLF